MIADDVMALPKEARTRLVELAIGRIFRMGARKSQPGDMAEYERCRAIIMAATKND